MNDYRSKRAMKKIKSKAKKFRDLFVCFAQRGYQEIKDGYRNVRTHFKF